MTIEEEMKVRYSYGYKEGRSEGEAAGIEKGRSEGAAQEKREIAKTMLQESIPKSVIAKITGLSLEEIEAL